MLWLYRAAKRLRELGILGMNRRNASFILDHNPRGKFPLVDDKLKMRDLCVRIGVATPKIHGVIRSYGMLKRLPQLLQGLDEFVIKPNCGSAGRGVLVVTGRNGAAFLRHNGTNVTLDELRQHCSDTLSGMYSLGGHPDGALIQQRVHLHPAFAPISWQGIPDIRVILYKNRPAMAMLRLPTKMSGGRANLHQGGIGTGVDLASGVTHHAVLRNRAVEKHPDTGVPVVCMQVPYWREVLDMSCRIAQEVGLGYVGVDIVVDAGEGPMLLEANARPGLAIQIANGQGLMQRLDEIDRQTPNPVADAAIIAGRIGPPWQRRSA